ncbi:MAG TPA: hypothetical protein VEG66_05495 [Thermoplasmata archaeon]|jgi:hypothetical protein|nr:hypothetical protein [Thermoplasmata archaeon]
MTVGSPTISASDVAGRWTGTSDSTESEAHPKVPPETWGEKVYAALPLFVVGGACLAVALDFYFSAASTPFLGSSSVRLAPWALFLALAVTGLSAGVFALLIEDEEPVPAPVRARPVAPVPQPSPAPPLWDESTLAPAKPSHFRPRTWERHAPAPEDFAGWSPAEPRVERVPPDVVLVQIDEIVASLRKKSPPSQEQS